MSDLKQGFKRTETARLASSPSMPGSLGPTPYFKALTATLCAVSASSAYLNTGVMAYLCRADRESR
jgi:hypothetical protein